MLRFQRVCIGVRKGFLEDRGVVPFVCAAAPVGALLLLCACGAVAQNVTTEHYDNARTGLNPNESILNTSNVNTSSFGKIFSQSVDGQIYAQPLYMAGLTISGKGTHNVVFVETENDSVYAFDADNNGGANASPFGRSRCSTPPTAPPAERLPFQTGTSAPPTFSRRSASPALPSSIRPPNTMYLVSASQRRTVLCQRLHALDITSGAEKFGGPVPLSGCVSGNGNGSSGGTLNFDTKWENNRAGLAPAQRHRLHRLRLARRQRTLARLDSRLQRRDAKADQCLVRLRQRNRRGYLDVWVWYRR